MKKLTFFLFLFLIIFSCTDEIMEEQQTDIAAANTLKAGSTEPGVFFDDFVYTGPTDNALTSFGWFVSTYSGGVGPAGSSYYSDMVSFANNSALSGDKVARLTCSTNGTASGTRKSELYHQKLYANGTWVARIRFTNAPTTGPDVDQMVQTFFGYSVGAHHNEIDFEYLPNGGWGQSSNAMLMSCYTPSANNQPPYQTFTPMDASGWKVYMMQVEGSTIRHYIDGVLKSTISRSSTELMYLMFNHWIIAEGLSSNSTFRSWEMDIDWVYFARGINETNTTVLNSVNSFRSANIKRINTMGQSGNPGGGVAVTGVTLSPTSASIAAGGTQQLTATVAPTNATNKTVSYTSSNTGVATVNASGLVTAISAGSATITVTTQDGNKTATCAVTVSGSGSLPSPWATANIGSTGVAGSASYSGTTFTAAGSGADIWGTADAFRYVYQQVSGDVTITARVVSLTNTDGWAKAGVMVRNGTGANVAHALTAVTVSNGLAFQRRTSVGGESSHTAGPGGAAPYWVRLQRSGSTFTSYISTNGSSWTAIGSQSITMSASVYVGLAVTSHNNGVLCTATFDNVTVTTSTNIAVTGVSLSPTSASIAAGGTQQLTATVAPSNATNKTVSYTSSNTAVATVNASGLVSAVTAGSATITVTTQDGNKTATCAVTVTGGGGGTNIAPLGTGYAWSSNTIETSNNNRAALTAVNDGNWNISAVLKSFGEQGLVRWQGAGVVWSSARTITSVNFTNGFDDGYGNGWFASGFKLQYSTNGTTWVNTNWTPNPAYPNSNAAWNKTYNFSGGTLTNIRGIRIVGQTNSNTWTGAVVEIQVY